jgi:hypothetical protein
MIRQILMGGAISICNIVIHALIMAAVVRTSQATAKAALQPNLLLIVVMVATVSVLMAAHAIEIIVWSLAYDLVDAAPANANRVYFAFVNYTTLWVRGRSSGRALAVAWTDHCHEWHFVVRLVDCCYFRGFAENHGASCVIALTRLSQLQQRGERPANESLPQDNSPSPSALVIGSRANRLHCSKDET